MEPGRYRVSMEVEVSKVAGDLIFSFENGRKMYIAPVYHDLMTFERASDPEPPARVIVVDRDGDAWQKDHGEGWSMALRGDSERYTDVSWADLNERYGPLKVVHTPAWAQ